MQSLSPTELQNWLSIYAATSVCCAIAFTASIAVVATEMYRTRAWAGVTDVRSAILFLPKTWLRWQKAYLLSTPVTLLIVVWFASTLSW